jgi:hypothetical protein
MDNIFLDSLFDTIYIILWYMYLDYISKCGLFDCVYLKMDKYLGYTQYKEDFQEETNNTDIQDEETDIEDEETDIEDEETDIEDEEETDIEVKERRLSDVEYVRLKYSEFINETNISSLIE